MKNILKMDNGDNENKTIFEKEREIALKELNNSTNMLINSSKNANISSNSISLA